MSNSIKQVYASLEIGENDLKILVAEYYNTRFNILKVDKISTKSISDYRIIDKQLLIDDLKKLIDDCSEKLGARIEQVILVIPAYNFKRVPLKSKVFPEKGFVSKTDIARAITNSLSAKVDFDVMVINPMISKYTINGISTRRMPEKELCDEMIVDIDLLCADRDMTYDYVSVVEQAGLKVLDITLNTVAIGKEASLFEESLKQNLICLDIRRTYTYLSLFSKGKLVSTEVVFDGMNAIIDQVRFNYDIPSEDISRIIKYDVDDESKYLEDIVYAYSQNGETKTISKSDINDVTQKPVENLADKLITMCKPIIEQGATLFVTGEGQQMSTLVDAIKQKSECEVRSYFPDTIGVRDSSLTSLYGALFVYREKAILNDLNVNCIDLLEYDSKIDDKKIDSEGETITTKIKNLFKQYVQKGE